MMLHKKATINSIAALAAHSLRNYKLCRFKNKGDELIWWCSQFKELYNAGVDDTLQKIYFDKINKETLRH